MHPMAPPPLSFHDQNAVQAFLAGLPGGREAYPALRRALYRDGLTWGQALGLGPAPVAQALADRFVWSVSKVIAEAEAPDGSTKALWEAQDGRRFESVLMRHPSGRTTLCLSSQVGCALGCAFCSTGRLGWVRDLTASEVLEQASWAVAKLRAAGQRLRNVVFMGMGEPLLALDAVVPALEGLVDQQRFEVAPRYISLSTAGVVGALEAFSQRFPKIKVAVSLHAPRQDLRDRLMPGCRNWPLADLMPALDRYSRTTGHKMFLEYVMVAGVNDTERESAELAELLRDRPAHVNLIPYNPGPGSRWAPSDRPTLDRFQHALKEAGVAATVRRSAGDSIAAACGQLAGKAPSGNS